MLCALLLLELLLPFLLWMAVVVVVEVEEVMFEHNPATKFCSLQLHYVAVC